MLRINRTASYPAPIRAAAKPLSSSVTSKPEWRMNKFPGQFALSPSLTSPAETDYIRCEWFINFAGGRAKRDLGQRGGTSRDPLN
jgi:hypothetical protein